MHLHQLRQPGELAEKMVELQKNEKQNTGRKQKSVTLIEAEAMEHTALGVLAFSFH